MSIDYAGLRTLADLRGRLSSRTLQVRGEFATLARAGDEAVTRRACEALAATLPGETIHARDGSRYLERYVIEDAGPAAKALLHRFVASDAPTHLHNHPWSKAVTVVLTGGYRDVRRHGFRTLMPGDEGVLEAGDYHRVELLQQDAWTLFVAGQVTSTWHFLDVSSGHLVPWRSLAGGRTPIC